MCVNRLRALQRKRVTSSFQIFACTFRIQYAIALVRCGALHLQIHANRYSAQQLLTPLVFLFILANGAVFVPQDILHAAGLLVVPRVARRLCDQMYEIANMWIMGVTAVITD